MTQTLARIAKHYRRQKKKAARAALRELLMDSLPPLHKTIYEHVAANKTSTTIDMVKCFGRSIHEAGNVLGELHSWGLLCREKDGRVYVYRVSE